MKRICILRQGYYPFDPRVRKEALALVEKGHEVDVICLKGGGEEGDEAEDFHEGVRIHRLPVAHRRGGIGKYLFEYGSFFLLASATLWRLHRRKRFDFVQVNTLPDFLVFAGLIPKRTGAKVVLDLHEPAPELFRTIFGGRKEFLVALMNRIEQASIRFADRVITVSDEMKRNYVERGARDSKISVILNVPTPDFDRRLSEEAARKRNGHFSLVCHGSIIKRYGQDVAVKAVALLKDEIPTIHLDIMGSGGYEGEVRRLVSELGLQEQVRIHGLLPFPEMLRKLAEADVGLVPVEKNPYSDLVHTNKMFECIAMMKPVVISRTRAVEDFFGPDDSCLGYFEPGNEKDLSREILELYRDPGKREAMARNAYARFESVRWELQKETYCGLFQ